MNGTGFGRTDGLVERLQTQHAVEYNDRHPDRGTHTLGKPTCKGACGLTRHPWNSKSRFAEKGGGAR